MEAPLSFAAEEVRNRKVEVLRAVRRLNPGEVPHFAVRGQYARGWMKGEKVPAYREEKSVAPHSQTETFAALQLYIDNWRWQGVPFYLRTGKRMQEKTSSVTVQFRPVPHAAFPQSTAGSLLPNRLTIHIQPQMDISIRFMAKRPGLELHLTPAEMVFDYDKCSTQTPEAYETLLLDAMLGDASLFLRADQLEAAWDVITPVLEAWERRDALDFPNYAAGTWGPETAEALIARQGHVWAGNAHLFEP
jgi:glucose-6-phosphate 1-dehydrogenase